MPTVLRFDALRVLIYTNDHRPAHVHVRGGGPQAVFILHCPEGPPSLRSSYGFTTAALNRIQTALTTAITMLCDEWETIHADH